LKVKNNAAHNLYRKKHGSNAHVIDKNAKHHYGSSYNRLLETGVD
jgi:hypothetical protein